MASRIIRTRASKWTRGTLIALLSLFTMTAAMAEETGDGTLAAAIRASGHPCKKIVEKSGTEPFWQVTCNSGRYTVSKQEDDTFTVAPLD